MLSTAPPYALDAIVFPVPALAAYAGRAPLGGDREMALGALMAARLAMALLAPLTLTADVRERRADRAKHWITTLAMPQPARMALLRAFDASSVSQTDGSALATVAESLLELARTVGGHIDLASQQELVALADALRRARARPVAA